MALTIIYIYIYYIYTSSHTPLNLIITQYLIHWILKKLYYNYINNVFKNFFTSRLHSGMYKKNKL